MTSDPKATVEIRGNAASGVPVVQAHVTTVGGHEILPSGGHVAARWRSTVLPSGGQQNCPR